MGNNWILDVLSDLKAFAQTNNMPILAEQLGDASLVAAAEMTSSTEGASEGAHGNDTAVRSVYRKSGTSDFA